VNGIAVILSLIPEPCIVAMEAAARRFLAGIAPNDELRRWLASPVGERDQARHRQASLRGHKPHRPTRASRESMRPPKQGRQATIPAPNDPQAIEAGVTP
jgi:hypothetical protein